MSRQATFLQRQIFEEDALCFGEDLPLEAKSNYAPIELIIIETKYTLHQVGICAASMLRSLD
jgi:hypothetical protein